jgi:DNA-binding NtrC family response regulator
MCKWHRPRRQRGESSTIYPIRPGRPGNAASLKEFREEGPAAMEKNYLSELMRITGGDMKKACSISGLCRSRLYSLLHEYRLTKDR